MSKWLLVEDEVDIRNVVKVMFQVWGHQAVEFSNGNDAFDYLEDVDENLIPDTDLPALALMDIRMPGPNGNEIANRIRRTERLKNIPVILMTAFQLSEAQQKEFKDRDGVDRIIFKPLPDFEKFHAVLQDTIAAKKSATSNGSSSASTPSTLNTGTTPPSTLNTGTTTPPSSTS